MIRTLLCIDKLCWVDFLPKVCGVIEERERGQDTEDTKDTAGCEHSASSQQIPYTHTSELILIESTHNKNNPRNLNIFS